MRLNNCNQDQVEMTQDMMQCIMHDQQKNYGRNKRDMLLKDKQKRNNRKNKRY